MYEMNIGLEVHVELLTAHKIFCGCKNVFGAQISSNCCEICMGLPGAIPVFNEECLKPAIKAGIILGCNIREVTRFDRKNYFYPDLPKGYQISQLYEPFAYDGKVELTRNKKTIRIREIHMEDDAAKLMYENGNIIVDYNRCDVPLAEIVTMPDFTCADEVVEFLEILRKDLRAAGVTDGKLEQGSMRADVNLSVRKEGEPMGTRTEIKNLSSFKAVSKAIEKESERQISLLEKGQKIRQQTLGFDEQTFEIKIKREKENSNDYKYFPDPDLPPITISRELISSINEEIPELPTIRERRLSREYGIRSEDAVTLVKEPVLADLYEASAKLTGLNDVTLNLVLSSLPSEGPLPTPEALSSVASMLSSGKISSGMAKTVISETAKRGCDPESYVDEMGFTLITDEGKIEEAVLNVLNDSSNSKAVEDLRSGKDKVLGFLLGKVMRELGGKGDPQKVREILLKYTCQND